MENMQAYRMEEHGFALILREIRNRLFRKLTNRGTDLFLRGRDIISVSPQTSGLHEPTLTSFLKYKSTTGSSDFLIDIGANIGLTTCQNGGDFDSVFCFEPNPLCSHILKVNTEIALGSDKVQVFDFGLGERDEQLDLMIPKHNWGGAYVKSDSNSYSDEVLALKDGFDAVKPENYLSKQVDIKTGRVALASVFEQLDAQSKKSGIIKIDVEGMEPVVLQEIAAALPKSFKASIVFENWDKDFDFDALRGYFAGRTIKLQKLFVDLPYKTKAPEFLKGLSLLFGRKTVTAKDFANCSDFTGDIVLTVD